MNTAISTKNVRRLLAALLVALLCPTSSAGQGIDGPVQDPVFTLSTPQLLNVDVAEPSDTVRNRERAALPDRIPLNRSTNKIHSLPKQNLGRDVIDSRTVDANAGAQATAESSRPGSQLAVAYFKSQVGQPAEIIPLPAEGLSRPEFPQSPIHQPNGSPGLAYEADAPIAGGTEVIDLGLVADDCVTGCKHTELHGRTRIGRFLNGIYQGVCCPDPCYQPTWTMLANASLFTDALRPQHRQRFRWEFSNDYRLPDRAEYIWGQSGVKGPGFENSIDFHELSYYVETGGDKFAFFVKTPYRSNYFESDTHTAGFADLTTGTKTLLHDSDLLQIGLQFETHIPSANPLEGLGTGHVALEPSLLFGVQLSQRSYLQTQISEWIPIGGTPDFQGALLRYSASFNRTLWGSVDDTSLIATLEYSGISFQAGSVTTAVGVTELTSEVNFGRLGSGLRLNICNKFDIGFAAQFGMNDDSPSTVYRTEIQFRH